MIEIALDKLVSIMTKGNINFTGKFDRNINYQQLLQKTDGHKPETVDQQEALMSITLPSLIGIVKL